MIPLGVTDLDEFICSFDQAMPHSYHVGRLTIALHSHKSNAGGLGMIMILCKTSSYASKRYLQVATDLSMTQCQLYMLWSRREHGMAYVLLCMDRECILYECMRISDWLEDRTATAS